jgi:hypothetical protein
MCCAGGFGPDHRSSSNTPCPPVELPVEPLWCREAVCLLVPCKAATLARWMARHRGALSPAQYTGAKTRRRRLFTAGDIRTLRAALVSYSR